MRRRMVVALTAAALLLAPLATLASDIFGDVPGTLPQHDAINRVYAAGIMRACTAGTPPNFCPNDPVLRAQQASQWDRALGLNGVPNPTVYVGRAGTTDRAAWREQVRARDELQRLTAFVASVSPDIPWHVTAFHGDYKMMEPRNTTAEMLLEAASIGRDAGLRYVYAGNLPGRVGDLEDTRCASCGDTLVARSGYYVRDYRLTPDGRCGSCSSPAPGRWSPRFDGQISSRPFIPSGRRLEFRILNSEF